MPTHLFKITNSRDDVQVGWSGDDRDSALDSLVEALAQNETNILWQYAVTRGASGPEVAPLRKIAFFRAGIVRVEPVATDQSIVELQR